MPYATLATTLVKTACRPSLSTARTSSTRSRVEMANELVAAFERGEPGRRRWVRWC